MRRILLTGATGFIGKALTRHLSEAGYPIRVLLPPSPDSPDLPPGVPVEVSVSGLNDPRGLRAALVDVDVIYHLASQERRGASANLLEVDIQGTRSLVESAQEAGVDRFFYLSHLGADRASAYPIMTAKAIAEEHIRKSSLDYTILRTAQVFGPEDHFTTNLTRLLRSIPLIFLMPDQGDTLLQPLWIEDLATCLIWALDLEETRGELYKIGGPEQLTFKEIVQTVMDKLDINRYLVPVQSAYLRMLTVAAEYFTQRPPTTVFWLDYLAANRTCSLQTIPHVFNLLPSRFGKRLDYLTPD
jgi:NADH dehydrogenase